MVCAIGVSMSAVAVSYNKSHKDKAQRVSTEMVGVRAAQAGNLLI